MEQAFEEIFTTPIELRHLGPEDLLEPRKQELLFELDSLMSTSLYHKVEDVRSRLFHLTEEYNDIVRPRLGPLADNPEWRRIWLLINAFEGDLVLLVEARAIRLGDAVRAATSSNVPEIRDLATQTTDELREALRRLRDLRNRMLGLSGSPGFLELVEAGDRDGAIAATTGDPRP